MNKIIISGNETTLKLSNKKINVEVIPRKDMFGINRIIIDVLKDSELEIEYNLDDSKYDITININSSISLTLLEYKTGNKGKIQYNFNLKDSSLINIFKFNKCLNIREMVNFKLDSNACAYYNFKSISTDKELYDIDVRHNGENSISDIKNNCVNTLNGKVTIQVSGYVENGTKGCTINQNNRIINLTNNKCEIRPNLYIKEYDVEASHSALIGGFSADEMFYMLSRGINELEANKLLINGFLLSDIENEKMRNKISKYIKEYWR
jgi:Fe-S cluster assembly protein SufD